MGSDNFSFLSKEFRRGFIRRAAIPPIFILLLALCFFYLIFFSSFLLSRAEIQRLDESIYFVQKRVLPIFRPEQIFSLPLATSM